VPAAESVRACVLTGARSEELDEEDPPREVLRAYAPYALIVVIFSVAQIPAVKDLLARTTQTFDWPFLDVAGPTANRSPATSSAGPSCRPAAPSSCSPGSSRPLSSASTRAWR
jgi:hypothetical protein